MIEVKDLTKYYGSKLAVNHINFTVNDGEILGFLGPNGAGKSTTMNIMTGYISSSTGQVLINGVDILENPIAAKRNIGYLPEIPPLYQDMTVKAYLNFVYDLKKCKLSRKSHLEEIFKLCKITDVQDRILKRLSKGYRQRVGLAQALIGNPPILILDEPTVGLDPKQIIEIRTLIKKLGKRHTVILSSHILSEIQAVCDRIIIINKGTIVADDTIEDLSKAISKSNRLTVRLDGNREEVLFELGKISGVVSVTADMQREDSLYDYEIEQKANTDVRKDINAMVQRKGWNIYQMQVGEMTLEDAFLKMTAGEVSPVIVHNTKTDDSSNTSSDETSEKTTD
ncbi:MAG: ATP-binding cassette domain-containing protein [Ruminococcus sp.]|nr:ATP-binding cassette domain-containing protein [Ruminococcus sp.]